MSSTKTGSYENTVAGGEEVSAFIPAPLPPPDIARLAADLTPALAQAEHALQRLQVAGQMVPSLDWFIYAFVRKEAVLSSQIEGTQASLTDLFAHEGHADSDAGHDDIEEVCNYLDALTYARAELKSPTGLPLSMRLLNETHKRLMRGARGQHAGPGHVRTSQNWIGGTRPGNAVYVPPPPHRLGELLVAMEKYIHDADQKLHPLIRAGLLHVQFESIHPYLDGNGRIGRLLIMLLLEHESVLREPLLYLSLHFKRHRAEYYRLLSAVRTEADWKGWLAYFLDGVATIAEEAVASATKLFSIVSEDRQRAVDGAGASVASVRLFERLPQQPIVTTAFVIETLGVTKPTAGRAVDALQAAGILIETTGKKRDRAWAYERYLAVLREGTEVQGR